MTFGHKTKKVTRPLENLCLDLDSIKVKTACGASMFLLVIDEYSRFKWVFLLKTNDEAATHLTSLLRRLNTVFTHRHLRVQDLFWDQGTKFVNKKGDQLCKEEGISVHTTNAYPPKKTAWWNVETVWR